MTDRRNRAQRLVEDSDQILSELVDIPATMYGRYKALRYADRAIDRQAGKGAVSSALKSAYKSVATGAAHGLTGVAYVAGNVGVAMSKMAAAGGLHPELIQYLFYTGAIGMIGAITSLVGLQAFSAYLGYKAGRRNLSKSSAFKKWDWLFGPIPYAIGYKYGKSSRKKPTRKDIEALKNDPEILADAKALIKMNSRGGVKPSDFDPMVGSMSKLRKTKKALRQAKQETQNK